MNRLTLLGDIAGRVTVSTAGAPRVTAACVAIATAHEADLRAEVGQVSAKWASCTRADAETVIRILSQRSAAIGVLSVNKANECWQRFADDSGTLQKAIGRQSRKPAGLLKAPVQLAYWLLGGSAAMAGGHALKMSRSPQILDASGMKLIERRFVLDTEISGAENIGFFEGILRNQGRPSQLESLGYRMGNTEVAFHSEQQEPLLLLADYVAGLCHSSLLREPGRILLPISPEHAYDLLAPLRDCGKLVLRDEDFNHSFDEMLGPLMAGARAYVSG